MFCEKSCSYKFWKIHRKIPVLESLPPTRVFSSEFFKSFKNTFLYRTPLVAASNSIAITSMFFVSGVVVQQIAQEIFI